MSYALGIGEMRPFAAVGAPKGKPAVQMDQEFQDRQDAQPMVVRCAWCPEWVFEGPSGLAREAAAEHRRVAHPAARSSRKRWRSWTVSDKQRAA